MIDDFGGNIFTVRENHPFITIIRPPRFWGGMFANILPGGDVCQLFVKFNKKLANVVLYAKYNILYQNT